jgi:hypothetical protein
MFDVKRVGVFKIAVGCHSFVLFINLNMMMNSNLFGEDDGMDVELERFPSISLRSNQRFSPENATNQAVIRNRQ